MICSTVPKPLLIASGVVIASAAVFMGGCDESATAPTTAGSVIFGGPSLADGSTIEAVGGFISRGSGRLSIPLTITSGRAVPWAQLYVYLLTGDTYCGQNLPDAPTWSPLDKGHVVSVEITGFQIFRVPCRVTGIRAMLHTRNTGLLTPPTSSETVAEGALSVNYLIE